MKIERLIIGMVQTNCYIAGDETSKQAILIDPGDRADIIADAIETSGWKIVAIFLTHGHFDHILAANALREKFGVKIYVGIHEKELLENPEWNASAQFMEAVSLVADVFVSDKEAITFGALRCEVIETPGHTRGGVCYYFEKEQILFSGDTLFLESVGRTDLPTGNRHRILESINQKLLVLPNETKVYPGHGDETSIGYERRNNPYINESIWE